MKDERLQDLRDRLKAFGLRVMRLCDSLPRTRSANVIAYQLLRSGTSPGAQYREGIRSRSDAELISKLESATSGARRVGVLARDPRGSRASISAQAFAAA